MRGVNMYLSIVVFFLGFAMAIGGVYFYQRASDTDYADMRIKLHEAEGEYGLARDRYEELLAEAKKEKESLNEAFIDMRSRLDKVEKRHADVSLELVPSAKPFLVEVVESRPRVTVPQGAKVEVPRVNMPRVSEPPLRSNVSAQVYKKGKAPLGKKRRAGEELTQ